MDFIKEFGRIGKGDAASAGGKGASLGEMTQADIPVPPGFVILSGAFERFLGETNLNTEIDTVLHSVDQREMSTVEQASERIQALILGAKMPEDIARDIQTFYKKLDAPFVAVRSSATAEDSASAAWAGQLDSFLNTTEETLLANVQRCWASLFTPRAIFYRYEKELHTTKISVAVVVQKMVQSEVSGIAFSVHPVTEDYNQLIIEAGFGLGEAIVSGSVTPDSYVIEKSPRRIIDKNTTYQSRALWRAESGGNEWRELSREEGNKPALSDEQALALAEIILRIESHYGFPCDIEWAYEAGTFYITQSRPITTLAPRVQKDEPKFISPELAHFSVDEYQYMGLWKSDLFAAYFWVHWFNEKLIKKLEFSLHLSGCMSLKGGYFSYHKEALRWGLEEVRNMIADRTGVRSKTYRKNAEEDFVRLLERADAFIDSESTGANFRQVVGIEEEVMTYWVTSNLLSPDFDTRIAEKAVEEGVPVEDVAGLIPKFPALVDAQHADVKRLLGLLKERSLDTLLATDGAKLATTIQNDKELSRAFETHLKEFGWIELLNYIGTPLSLERLLDQLKTAASSPSHVQESHHPARKLSKEFEHTLNVAADVGFVRQAAAETSSIVHYKLLGFLMRTAETLGLTYREMLNLVPTEIIEGLDGVRSREQLKQTVQKRSGYNWFAYSKYGTGELVVIDEERDLDTLYKLIVPVADENAQTITGQTGNKGKVQGKVSVILATDDFHKFIEGNVLVTTMTTPDFVILMQKSVAIVTDIGGMLSHASIVSRELHKPCVIGTKFATQILHDGDLVEVDADNGVVRIVERAHDFVATLTFLTTNAFDIKEARASLLICDILFPTYAEKNCFGQNYSPTIIPYVKQTVKQVVREGQVNNLERAAWDVFIHSPAKFYSALQEANDIQAQIDSLALTPEKLRTADTKELLEYSSSLVELIRRWWRYGSIGEDKGLVVDEKLIPLLTANHRFSTDEAREYVMTMTTPSEQSIFTRERAAFLELCIEGGSNMQKIKKYAEDYFFARSDFYSATILTAESVLRLIAEQRARTTLSKLKEELAHISDNLQALVREKKELGRKVTLTADEQHYLSYFSTLQEWLDVRKLSMLKHFTYVFYLVEEVAKRIGIPYATLSLMTATEVKSVMKGEQLDLKKIQEREAGCVQVYREGSEPDSFIGAEAQQLIRAIACIGVPADLDELRGTIASKGKGDKVIRGTVRIVVDPSKDEFNEGEILVTSMTRPEFVPIMKSAIAIITDEGGIACHAAIVSRELGIPCIIGTKTATRVLTTGDLVEVDADSGVVRILKRAENKNGPVIESIKGTEWHSDWSGPFSLFGLSLPTNTYFDGMEKYFGKGLSQVFIAFKNGIAFSRLPDDEYHELGMHLIWKAQDAEFVKEWASRFKKLADTIVQETAVTAEEYVRKLPELLPHYQAYGAHNAATKIAFDVGYDELSKESKSLLEEARKYSETFYKDDADNIEKALHYLAKKTGYAYEEVYMLTYDELRAYFDTGILPDRDALKKRWVASGIHFTKNKTTILSPEELEEVENHRLGSINRTELTGQIAYRGKVQGRCRIILDYKNASLKKGDILVTGMTDPNFVELMKKAAGIVTDGGGMLSHAAIVARELRKPCVIGTKIATQVLKDGDLVEVDADNGVVRILK